jgi:hypothetical protein
MKLRPAVSRRTYIISATLFLLMGLFGYYFLAFLPKQENQLIAQRVRALERIKQNFEEKYDVFRKNDLSRRITKISKKIDRLNHQHDSLERKTGNPTYHDRQELQEVSDSLALLVSELDSLEEGYSNYEKSEVKNIFTTPFKDFFSPLKILDSFDGYIVYRDSALIYQDLPGEVLRVPAQLYTELSKGSEQEGRYARHNLEAREPERYDTPRVYEAGTKAQLAAIDYRLFCTDFATNSSPQETRWTIYGLVTKDHFDDEKKRISFFNLVFISLGLLLLLFSMPLMKLFFMSSIERLHRKDALLTPPTFIVCSAIVTLIFLVTAKYYLSDIPKLDRRLQTLATSIKKEFTKEIQSIYQLTKQVSAVKPPTAYTTISVAQQLSEDNDALPNFEEYPFLRSMYWLDNSGKQTFEYSMLDAESYDYEEKSRPAFSNRDYFKAILQGKGYPLVSRDTLSYLQSIVSWTTGEPVSVFSLPLANDTTILPRGNAQSKVLAISTVLNSVTDPVLPPGFGFSIIDQDGLVLYHTDRQKNLQENLLQEVDHNPHLMAALASESSVTTDVSYFNRSYRLHLQPISNIPWYMVTTYDKEFLESPYQYILTFSTLGIILISGVTALQFLLIALIYHRSSKLKRHSLTFKWLWPYRSYTAIADNQQKKPARTTRYLVVASLNLIYGVLLLIYNQVDAISLPQTVASFLLATVFSYSTTFALLQEVRDWRYFGALGASLVLSILILFISLRLTVADPVNLPWLLVWSGTLALCLVYVTSVALRSTNKPPDDLWKKRDTLITSGLIVVILVLALLLLNDFVVFSSDNYIVQQFFLWASFYLLALIATIIGNKIGQLFPVARDQDRRVQPVWVSGFRLTAIRKVFLSPALTSFLGRHSYCLMIFSFLALSSFLFIWFLFSKSYDNEKRIWTKYSLYQIHQGLEERDDRLQSLYQVHHPDFELVNIQYQRYERAKPKALYYRPLKFTDRMAALPSSASATKFDSLMYNLRPIVTDLAAATNGFVLHSGDKWQTVSDQETLRLAFLKNNYFDDQETNIPLRISRLEASFPLSFRNFYYQSPIQERLVLSIKPPHFLSVSLGSFTLRHTVLLLAFFMLMFITYWLLKFTIFRLFGVEAFRFQQVIQIDDELMEYERENPGKRQDSQSPHKFIVSMPFAGAEELYGSEPANYTKIDFSRALEDTVFPTSRDQVLEQKNNDVVLEHFSYGIEDQTTNQRRLVLLEILLANNNRITIISKLTPMQITAKYEEIIEEAENQADVAELETRVSRWKDILSSFVKLYYSKLVCERNRSRLPLNCTVKELIYHEMSVNQNYFRRMNGTLVEEWNRKTQKIKLTSSVEKMADSTDEDTKEEILLKIQSMAQPFYFSLWNTCSKEEKYILYDLADDGFVNTRNKPVLMGLMEKGLIFYDESFHIMNESFRNFILSNIKQSEALKMEQEARNNGRWSVYSTVILLLILSLIFFVVFANEGIVNQFVALLAGITAAVPYLLRLVGLVGLSTGSRSNA